ncbi:MAG: hypothetical protein HQL37_06875 [Alphaproteobacteria bacterium]|nr:hypothetical protein [Alphaproteobacteria bacterium]
MDDCRRRYLEHLRMVAAGRARDPAADLADDGVLDLEAERAGLARTQSETHELRNAATRLGPKVSLNVPAMKPAR